MPDSVMNRYCCSKVSSVSLSKPMMKPAEHVDSVGIDAPHRGQDVLGQVLRLQGFLETGGIGRFDADEHPAEVRRAEKLQQLLVLRQVERGFGAEAEPVVVLFLVFLQELQQELGLRLVADQVIVHEEHPVHPGLAQRIQLAPDLLQRLDARLAAEHHDDVAELAAERAAARVLQRRIGITGELQQFEARHRRIGECDGSGLVVKLLRRASREVRAELLSRCTRLRPRPPCPPVPNTARARERNSCRRPPCNSRAPDSSSAIPSDAEAERPFRTRRRCRPPARAAPTRCSRPRCALASADGHSAASVARPSGGQVARKPGSTSFIAHLNDQKLSGNFGLISRMRMVASEARERIAAAPER